MGFIPQANPNGQYWAEGERLESFREVYYSIIPLENGKPKFIRNKEWLNAYNALGELGYFFSDAGNSSEQIVVALNKQITKKHLKQLEDSFDIKKDDGNQLHFIGF